MTTLDLRFGLPYVIPDDAVGAYGARLIVKQDGFTDFLYDRQDTAGDEQAMVEAWRRRTTRRTEHAPGHERS